MKVWWFGAVLLWIGIPGVVSGVYYYRKWTGAVTYVLLSVVQGVLAVFAGQFFADE